MRSEQIIAAVTRNLVIAMVREIEAIGSFANAHLHLWLQRTTLGMSGYTGDLPMSSFTGDVGGLQTRITGSKRGRLLGQPMLVLASCPAGSARG